jgi:hypothetical protein
MTAQPTPQRGEITLRDYSNFTIWFKQLQNRCIAHDIWDKVDPESTTPLTVKPVANRIPVVAEYAPAANIPVPTRQSELSSAGQKAFKEDLEYYKLFQEQFKNDRHEYEREQASIQHIVTFIQQTVASHLQNTCCLPNQSPRQWITSIKLAVGVDDRYEKERARDRYLAALKQMRSITSWESWLAEYDQAATEAETYLVAEVTQLDAVTKDFLAAVNKVAPVWATAFQDYGRYAAGMTRKEMMKRFREHMMANNPSAKGKQRAAFVTSDPSRSDPYGSFLADSGETTQGNDRDASHAEHAPSKGRPLKRKRAHPQGTSRPYNNEPNTAGPCPACKQSHAAKDCYYLYEEKAPAWWKPRPAISELIELKRKHDSAFQGLIRGQSRSRTQTPHIKLSHTPTPTQSTEASDE